MKGIKRLEPKKYIELGFEKEEDSYFYTKIKDNMEITFDEDSGILLMCKVGDEEYFNSNDYRFNDNLIQDLIDEDLIEEKELYVEEKA